MRKLLSHFTLSFPTPIQFIYLLLRLKLCQDFKEMIFLRVDTQGNQIAGLYHSFSMMSRGRCAPRSVDCRGDSNVNEIGVSYPSYAGRIMKEPHEVLGVRIVGGLQEASTPWAGASLLVVLPVLEGFRRSGVDAVANPSSNGRAAGQGIILPRKDQAGADGGKLRLIERFGWRVCR